MATYRLTERIAARFGGPVIACDLRAIGRDYNLFSKRPDASLNVPATMLLSRPAKGARAEQKDEGRAVTVVRIDGPIEQRAGYHECGGWSDGHDAIAERLEAAFADGDVVLVIDSPGGAVAGLQEGVKRALAAKAANKRHCYVYADELIASAAYWWACALADTGNIYGPEAMQIGSVGARSGHISEAEALKKQGVAVTYFAMPGDGKIAFAPEFPLSETGRKRGMRDVKFAYRAFASAVTGARPLTKQDLVDLDADVLPGSLAVKKHLADGISSLDDVILHALAVARDEERS